MVFTPVLLEGRRAMLRPAREIRYHIRDILAAHWAGFVAQYKRRIRRDVSKNVRQVLACRTPVLGCHVYKCPKCDHVETVPHSCKSRFCPTCGKHATEVWADEVLNGLLDVPYHHLIVSLPWQLRIVVLLNRRVGLNLVAAAAREAVQQWARDIKGMRMGIVMVLHTFGADLKWHPHVHLIVTGGGLSLDGKRWIATDERFLMYHAGLKERWKYQVVTRMKKAHRAGELQFSGSVEYLERYPRFAAMVNKLWRITWWAFIGASLRDPGVSVRYIGRYTKRAVLAEYRITHYDGKLVRFSFKDYAAGGKTNYKTLTVYSFIGRLIRHIPDKSFPMVRHAGLFSNRWKHRYLPQARAALGQQDGPETSEEATSTWAERQLEYTGVDPLRCPKCDESLEFVRVVCGEWATVQVWFERGGRDATIPEVLLGARGP